jgi:phosphate:Na+ symporter
LALGFIYNDAINNFERISDHCSNIAMAVLEANDARLLPHAYLHALEETGEEGYRSQLAIYQEKYLSQFTSVEV